MGDISLYKRAVGDYKLGRKALEDAYTDDVMCDLSGYLLQQTVEKLLKFQIELQGDDFPFTHKIPQLLDKVKGPVPAWIVDNREKLTSFEALTRYSSVKVASVTDLRIWYDQIEEYIAQLSPDVEGSSNFPYEPKI